MSRTRTRERRKQREQDKGRQKKLTIALVLGVLAVLALAFVVISSLPADAALPEGLEDLYVRLPQSETEEGFAVLGNPEAPVSVVEVSSFDCPSCGLFYKTVTPELIGRVRDGEISLIYVPVHGTGGMPNGQGAARAAVCAGEQEAFWPYHSMLFSWQDAYGNAAYSGSRLASGVDALELDRAAWDACINSNRPDTVITEAISYVNTLGDRFQGTPTILVNGEQITATSAAVHTAIDAALAASGIVPIPVDQLAETEAEAEATEEAAAEVETEAEATEEAEESTVSETEAEEETVETEATEEADE